MLLRPNSNGLTDFIPAARIEELLRRPAAEACEVRDVLAKSMDKQRLSLEEMAALLSVASPGLLEEMFAAARQLKHMVYGNRIVLFRRSISGTSASTPASTAASAATTTRSCAAL